MLDQDERNDGTEEVSRKKGYDKKKKNRVMDAKTQLVAEYTRNEDLDAKEVGKHLVKYIYAKKERWYEKKEHYS